MRKRILLGVVTALGLIGNTVQAQDGYKCGLPQRLRELYAADPQLEADQYNLVHQFVEHRTVNGQTRDVYIIPIVFHIIHTYGSENISDQNIYDEIEILNRDYTATNPDINTAVPAFDTLQGVADIEFRLATIDPLGNCTNGIEHIYSNTTNNGDDYSKVNQWNRSKYLNVWLVRTIGESGVAGYAYYPTATISDLTFADGVIILYDYVGSLSPSSPFTSRALTHEIGHYLGLAHTWGNTNDPEVACGDDGILDTPVTAGHLSCTAADLADTHCDTVHVENTQNFMEYSYCSMMFTKDQTAFMRNTLIQETSQRNNLVTDANHIATGTATMPGVTCTPQADYSVDNKFICEGSSVTYKDQSWKAGVTSWSWTFPDGSPATSTNQNPTVTYATSGWKTATLTVTNSAGTNTISKTNYVYVSPGWADFTGPVSQDFDSGSDFWTVVNEPGSYATFAKAPGYGRNNTKGYALKNYRSDAPQYYIQRLGESIDDLISPAYNLSTTTGMSVSFDYAYGTNATTIADITEKLLVYSSTDCGKTWTQRKLLKDTALVTGGYVGNTDFAPTASEWKTATFNLSSSSSATRLRLKFEFVASDKSSNFYIDNINISGVLGLEENAEISGISISPNPVASGSDVKIQLESLTQDVDLYVTDISGKILNTIKVSAASGASAINIPMNVEKGCYVITAVQGTAKSTHRVVVM